MPPNRSRGRNVHIYNVSDRCKPEKEPLGGLELANGVTNSNFFSMLGILLVFESTFSLTNEQGITIEANSDPLQPGSYYVAGSFSVNNEPWLTRTLSLSTGTRVPEFCDAVRARDGRCVVSGQVAENAYKGFWWGFEASHIFPLAYEEHWMRNDFSRWITILPANGGPINSVQNGLLLRSDIHGLFDNYAFSIDPDDEYKIIPFQRGVSIMPGGRLDRQLLDSPDRPADQLLRWHFRQAVFANMRGAGEPGFENDFPPGSDMVGQIREGPKAAERMEFELFSRLALHSQ
ncbi:MAG: hypothetical protein Q9217_004590 [Psora testacea]